MLPKGILHRVVLARSNLEEPFDQDQRHMDRKQELHKEVAEHHTVVGLRKVVAKLHKVVAKHHMEVELHMVEELLRVVGLHKVVELPHKVREAINSQEPHKEEAVLHMAEGVAVRMGRPYNQVGMLEVI